MKQPTTSPPVPDRAFKSPYRNETPAQTILLGSGAIRALSQELEKLRLRRIVVISSPSAARSGAMQLVQASLGTVEIVWSFDRVQAHAPIADSELLAQQLVRTPIDAIISVGGGSASDTAKAVAVVLAEGGPLEDRCSTFSPQEDVRPVDLPSPKIPIIAIPTTLSGAEITPSGGATNSDGVKRVFWDSKLAARVVALDPRAIADVPEVVLTTTGFNGLAHCAEAAYSRGRSPLTKALALEGAKNLCAGLLRLRKRSGPLDQVFEQLQLGAAFGGMVISNARMGLHHAVCHVVGPPFHVSHGLVNAIILPYVLAFNLEASQEEQEELATAIRPVLGAYGVSTSGSLARLVSQLQKALELPSSLREAGVPREQLLTIARAVMGERGLHFNPRRIHNPDQLLPLLIASWNGSLDMAEAP